MSSSEVSTEPMNSQEPNWRETRLVCLPCQPRPEACAKGFSSRGAVSTKTFTSLPKVWAIQVASCFSRFLIRS